MRTETRAVEPFEELTASRIMLAAKYHGGGTLDRFGHSLTTPTLAGKYAVGLGVDRWTFIEPITATTVKRIDKYLTLNRPLFESYYVGVWVDKGILFVEPVELVSDRRAAVVLGRWRAQKAIYDFDRGESIVLAGEPPTTEEEVCL